MVAGGRFRTRPDEDPSGGAVSTRRQAGGAVAWVERRAGVWETLVVSAVAGGVDASIALVTVPLGPR